MPLKRTLGLGLLVLYGLGTILGAGIYVLIGEVAGLAGSGAPLAFLLAGAVVALTALSYAELGGRYPVSAGEAFFVQQAFRQPWLSRLTGLLIIAVGVVSSATLVNGVAGYAGPLLPVPAMAIKLLVIATLVGLALWGIRQSALAVAFSTVLAISGLLLVIAAGIRAPAAAVTGALAWVDWPQAVSWPGVLTAAFLAFYAFLGFEDMINIGEEVKNPQRNLPLGIVLVLLIAMGFYLLVAVAVLQLAHPDALAASTAPLALAITVVFPGTVMLLTLISLVAIINGALVQIIKSSRILYGMAAHGLAPAALAQVSARTQTPLQATVLVGLIVLVLAMNLAVLQLAWLTSFITLLVFMLANAALIRIRRQTPATGFRVPPWVPWCGLLLSAAFLLFEMARRLALIA